MSEHTHPIEGQIVLLAGAQASVPLRRLSTLLEHVQRHLGPDRETYARRFECIDGETRVYYLLGDGDWERVGEELDLDEREVAAVKRAHREQFLRAGRRLDREAEFETALEIRQPVAVA